MKIKSTRFNNYLVFCNDMCLKLKLEVPGGFSLFLFNKISRNIVFFLLGFQLNNEIMSVVVLRFMRKDGTLRFGDFVAAILHLTVAFCKLAFETCTKLICPQFLSCDCTLQYCFSAIFDKKDPLMNGTLKLNLSDVSWKI